MGKIKFLFFILVFLISCSRKNNFDDVKQKLINMKSYSAEVEVDVYGNKGVSHYKVVQYFKEPNLVRIETNVPSFLKGKILVFDGRQYFIYHPIINQKYSIQKLKDDDVFIFLGIIDKKIFLDNSQISYKRIGDKNYISFKVELKDSTYRKYVELFFNQDNMLPEIMTFYDEGENVRVNILYNNFKYNPTLDDSLFKI
ncbi:Outer membrane lipoprotein-sorting protein [Caloramator fervidus]|uniref:Outer membrane lipoprotein-sorting protein n=1 Tax=Caloramator fervidus TaxID=29344 RepID=A0A1H5TCB2_9CLOT|nr:outer-membrane lipoprotein carrier protein LolA [Caloramator fervidus]SEF60475.1 Outer membrane lipoprotein-sorting protein [Caloramator fervidus]